MGVGGGGDDGGGGGSYLLKHFWSPLCCYWKRIDITVVKVTQVHTLVRPHRITLLLIIFPEHVVINTYPNKTCETRLSNAALLT